MARIWQVPAVTLANKELGLEPQPQVETPPFALTCLECETVDFESAGWKAYLSEEHTLLIYCAECAEREFGDYY